MAGEQKFDVKGLLSNMFGMGRVAVKLALQQVVSNPTLCGLVATTMCAAEGGNFEKLNQQERALWTVRAQNAISGLLQLVGG